MSSQPDSYRQVTNQLGSEKTETNFRISTLNKKPETQLLHGYTVVHGVVFFQGENSVFLVFLYSCIPVFLRIPWYSYVFPGIPTYSCPCMYACS